ncbi:MAG: tRNA epoxyqueuosine(34) reductase QueG [Chitinophagaceae bacterium]
MLNQQKNTLLIKQEAARLGFTACNIAKAQPLDDEARRLESWLKNGYQGGMQYMENHFDLRIDPGKLVPGAKSVIVLLLNYYPEQQQAGELKISKYAYGKDYHEVIKEKLKQLLLYMRENIGEVNGRGFVDSAPVLERSWATRSGLGWVGKNGNLISRQQGSFFFIATLITDLELQYGDPFAKDYCGSCRRCIEACPTEAILDNKVIDGSKCISYFTIELKEMLIPENMQGKFDNWMFGCDTCQDVCPWNRFATPTQEEGLTALPEVLNLTTKEWEAMTEESFRDIFRNSPLKRAKFKGIQRNLAFLKK